MSTGRFTAPGKTRSCPHCKATILESATVCPGCHHHLRFDSTSARGQAVDTALRVDGVLRHPANGETWEYSLVLAIRNARGEEISRQVVGVGALQPADERTFSLAVEVFKPAVTAARPPVPAKPAEPAPSPQAVKAGAPVRPGERPAAASTAATAAPRASVSPGVGTAASPTHGAPQAPVRTTPRLGGR